MSARDDRQDALVRFLAATSSGATLPEITAHLACSPAQARTSIHDARMYLGGADDVNIVCDMDVNSDWRYHLVGSLKEAGWWIQNRLDDAETRARTMESVAASIVRNTAPGSTQGRKARVVERSLRRMREDLDDIHLNGRAV